MNPDIPFNILLGDFRRKFCNSKWSTRAWTLQELIAPRKLVFYDATGAEFGSRDGVLNPHIREVTKIPEDILRSTEDPIEIKLSRCSIAKRIAWASSRSATRIEDQAYSLLGIFDINMPMLYGEGSKAFVRLQEEIIKNSTDHSIFAHKLSEHLEWNSLFALRPVQFANCHRVEACGAEEPMESYSMTNRGLLITLPVIRVICDGSNRQGIVVALNCREKGAKSNTTLTL